MNERVTAIICAAGKGSRAGFEKNKLLVPLRDGQTSLEKTLTAFDFPLIAEIVVACSPADEAEISALAAKYPRTRTVVGGETRTQSVYNALKAASGEIVLIHDGARPFVTRAAILGCVESIQKYGSGVCAVPAVDTVSIIGDDFEILSTPDRKNAVYIQTPQGFCLRELLSAYEQATNSSGEVFTDDASVYAKYVRKPRVCAGARENIKLTYAEDFRERFARVGFGVDTHAFGKAQDYIVLAGVEIPSDSGLIAHSDGDVLVHAVMDALLSAAGLRDIGYYFPDKDEKWRGADSMKMLDEVVRLVKTEGFKPKNLSAAIQAEKPRLAKYIEPMKQNLARALGVDENAIGLSAGTNEGLGYIGEGKGITVTAYTLLEEL